MLSDRNPIAGRRRSWSYKEEVMKTPSPIVAGSIVVLSAGGQLSCARSILAGPGSLPFGVS